ncbi:hypothetical protein GOP47_0011948 [Adiantum capillus-veneris]|uniref:Uncharacterized protein n=1 Tax=Adiantum capillus-veneris TaxID=13818 RepID=A0A9D4UTQ2_ADICA|nr:hypothetical protein GOP47_0011948 [Adiantum capillus-veneris]
MTMDKPTALPMQSPSLRCPLPCSTHHQSFICFPMAMIAPHDFLDYLYELSCFQRCSRSSVPCLPNKFEATKSHDLCCDEERLALQYLPSQEEIVLEESYFLCHLNPFANLFC